jgi:ABC-type Zn uptake system ZnuABC Zn-binding protein ZnuA
MQDPKNKLENLHELLAQKLLERLRDPEVKASDLNVARQFLKDNNIDCIPTENRTVSKLAEELPFKLSDLKEIIGEDQFN